MLTNKAMEMEKEIVPYISNSESYICYICCENTKTKLLIIITGYIPVPLIKPY